jgi:hypothetical protein
MNKKIIAIIIFIIILIISGAFLILNKSGEGVSGDENSQSPSIFGGFFDFGNGSTLDDEPRQPSPTGNSDTSSLSGGDAGGLKLQQLANTPVAGYIASTTNVNNILVRYVEKTSGNIFDIELRSLSAERITNTTLPRLYDAYFHNYGDRVLLRYVKDNNDVVKTYFGLTVSNGTSTPKDEFEKFVGGHIEDGVIGVTPNQSNNKFLISLPDSLGLKTYIMDIDNDEKIQSFSHDFGEWKFDWINEDTLIATPKASYIAEGAIYKVDIDSGQFEKIYGSVNGLSAVSNTDASKILFSKSDKKSISTHLLNSDTLSVGDLEIQTFSEKCIWSKLKTSTAYCAVPSSIPSALYPDEWYQGLVTFSDRIVEVNAEDFSVNELANPVTLLGVGIDAIDLSMTEDESLLLFRNKKDSTLWSLELPNIIEEIFVDDEEIDTEEES